MISIDAFLEFLFIDIKEFFSDLLRSLYDVAILLIHLIFYLANITLYHLHVITQLCNETRKVLILILVILKEEIFIISTRGLAIRSVSVFTASCLLTILAGLLAAFNAACWETTSCTWSTFVASSTTAWNGASLLVKILV